MSDGLLSNPQSLHCEARTCRGRATHVYGPECETTSGKLMYLCDAHAGGIQMWKAMHANDPVMTGTTLYVKAKLPATYWLSVYQDNSNVIWGAFGEEALFEFQIFEGYEPPVSGLPVNVGDTIYLWSLYPKPQSAQWVGVTPQVLELFGGPSPFIINTAS